MAEMKHTPTPWRVSGPDYFGDYTIQPADEELAIAAVVNGEMRRMGGNPNETEANARLIAHAVNCHADLVEALRELADALDYGLCNSGTPGFDSGRLGRAQDAARAAIARAEGGE